MQPSLGAWQAAHTPLSSPVLITCRSLFCLCVSTQSTAGEPAAGGPSGGGEHGAAGRHHPPAHHTGSYIAAYRPGLLFKWHQEMCGHAVDGTHIWDCVQLDCVVRTITVRTHATKLAETSEYASLDVPCHKSCFLCDYVTCVRWSFPRSRTRCWTPSRCTPAPARPLCLSTPSCARTRCALLVLFSLWGPGMWVRLPFLSCVQVGVHLYRRGVWVV